jgi:hypothetical protein
MSIAIVIQANDACFTLKRCVSYAGNQGVPAEKALEFTRASYRVSGGSRLDLHA